MNKFISQNYERLTPWLFAIPILLLVALPCWLYTQSALSVEQYPQVQKDCFLYLNHFLGQYPHLAINITQMGNAVILLAFVSIFILHAPKMWEAIISGLIVSFILTIPKHIFSVPRPAAVYDNDTFIIIGERLTGFNSTPSGHSITIFTIVAIILFSFMPRHKGYNFLWILFSLLVGALMVLSRVAVGAHYPLDVLIGSAIGFISGLAGIFICRRYSFLSWIANKRYYPIFILLITACAVALIYKIITLHLPIFYLALIFTLFSLYKISHAYIKE